VGKFVGKNFRIADDSELWEYGQKLNLIFLLECNAANILGKYTKAENLPA
jgi:hypothetical protein